MVQKKIKELNDSIPFVERAGESLYEKENREAGRDASQGTCYTQSISEKKKEIATPTATTQTLGLPAQRLLSWLQAQFVRHRSIQFRVSDYTGVLCLPGVLIAYSYSR